MPKDIRGGIETYWRQFGQGPREALFIHCSLASSGAWTPVAKPFEQAMTITAFDLPSHGKSAPWEPQYDYQTLVTAMAADFWTTGAGREAVLTGPVDLVGHSFGGTVALRLAVERPDLVRSLTMIDPVYFAVYRADTPGGADPNEGHDQAYLDAVARGDDEGAAKAFVGRWGDGRPWDSLTEEARAKMTRQIKTIAASSAAINEDNTGMLAAGALERLDVPTLLVAGADSPPHIAVINAGIARRIKGAQNTTVPGGHMAPVTDPEGVIAVLKEFWGMDAD